jgi:hypothetical protein
MGRACVASHTLAYERCTADAVLWNTSYLAPDTSAAGVVALKPELVVSAKARTAHFHASLECDAAACVDGGAVLVRRAYESAAPDGAAAAEAVAAAAHHRPLGGACGGGDGGVIDVAGVTTWRVPRNALIIVTIQLIGVRALAGVDDRCLLVVTDLVPSGLRPLSVCTPSSPHGKWWEEEELRAGRVQLSVRASVLRTLFEGLGSVCHPPPSPTA